MIENHTNIMSLNKAFPSMTFTEWRNPTQGWGDLLQHSQGFRPTAESVRGGSSGGLLTASVQGYLNPSHDKTFLKMNTLSL